MAEMMTLSGDYGFQSTRLTPAESVTIDASDARWIVANIGDELNRYPVIIEGGSGVTIFGGTIAGQVPMDMEWTDAYVNSAALFLRNPDDVVVRDWSITRAWDGIRLRGDESASFTIDGVYLSQIRDDAIENDSGVSGTISNSFFDGVFVGFSTGEANMPDRSDNVITIDNVLVRMEASLHKGKITHQSPFKTFDNSPQMEIHNSVFAIVDPDHAGQPRLPTAWEKTISASNNYYLNLSDTPFPKNYPLPGEGFTVLQGKEARDFWAKESAAWESSDGIDDDNDNDNDNGVSGSGIPHQDTSQEKTSSDREDSEQDRLESRSKSAVTDDDGPRGFFGLIARIFQAIFGGGRSSEGGVEEAGASAMGRMPSRSLITEEDLGRIMLPPLADTTPFSDHGDVDEDNYAII
jgi:hypothetical protein